jgi:hypothetical protein
MIAAAFLIVLIVLVATVAVAGGLRRVVRDEAAVERRLLAPGTPTMRYAVPAGVDAANLRAAVARAGFTAIVGTTDTRQCLQVECSEGDRARLRRQIEDAHESAYDGTELDLRPVVFEDEKPSAA